MSKLNHFDRFENRHIGINQHDTSIMLKTIGISSLEKLIEETVPPAIRLKNELNVPEALSEFEYLKDLKEIALKNQLFTNFIGQGYYGTITPSVILRNVFQNPGWYTQYTPYQAEIAQGRLESLLNFQTLVSDLTGLPIANASLLDEGTAVAEAMHLFYTEKNKKAKGNPANVILVADNVFSQSIDVLKTRAEPLSIEVKIVPWDKMELDENVFGIVLQYPGADGQVHDYRALTEKAKSMNIYVTVATDLMALALLTPPGEWGADAVVGNSQRFGVPMGFGGPHAAFFATKEDFKRQIPGRIIGLSSDIAGKPALRMALQTREQHIRREKATSNICTAQALLANMAAMYAVYHGPKGIKAIAERVHLMTNILGESATKMGYKLLGNQYFDTITLVVDDSTKAALLKEAQNAKINFFESSRGIQISVDESHTVDDLKLVCEVLARANGQTSIFLVDKTYGNSFPSQLSRTSEYLTHPVFSSYHTESLMMRYIKRLENRDLSLTHSMISLGSCTMKLNAATEMIPVSWELFANIHPFAPTSQTMGYQQIISDLAKWLCEITGFDACSLQPNSGAQGEYAGLLTIRAYHQSRGDSHRDIAIIPSSAHGTNPASAVMAGMKVVVVDCDERGNVDLQDLKLKVEANKDNLACLMVTYPSTHGVFETAINEICTLIHKNGGKVYMDGANMNAQVGLTSPAAIGADVCHLNLHKTFAIPHGGGGPGMGPICVNESLAPFLPGHVFTKTGGNNAIHAVSAAPFGSASILLISYAYIRMLGPQGLKNSTKYAILNANYMKARLESHYPVLYSGENGRAAHEMILDLRPLKSIVSAEDVAKRLIDYGFHAPTLSFPVAGTIMIEPTESEDLAELDRFCDAMIEIKKEIDEIAEGKADPENNVLSNAPHTMYAVMIENWDKPYSREKAAFPLPYLQNGFKFWPTVGRIDQAKGDRTLICTCPPMEMYREMAEN
jgi:glycine dehydrogenase